MNDKEKERITLMFINAVKEASEYLSSMDNAHEYDPAFLELWASIRIEPKRQSLLNFLLKDSTYAMRCSEEYLDQLLSKKLRDVIYKLVKKEPGPLNRQARKAVGEVFEQIDTITDKYTCAGYISNPPRKLRVPFLIPWFFDDCYVHGVRLGGCSCQAQAGTH